LYTSKRCELTCSLASLKLPFKAPPGQSRTLIPSSNEQRSELEEEGQPAEDLEKLIGSLLVLTYVAAFEYICCCCRDKSGKGEEGEAESREPDASAPSGAISSRNSFGWRKEMYSSRTSSRWEGKRLCKLLWR
jgi:hypothetical protein